MIINAILILKRNCCIIFNNQIRSCLDDNNPNPNSTSFHKSLNEFNIKDNNPNIGNDLPINKNQYYNEGYNDQDIKYHYKKENDGTPNYISNELNNYNNSNEFNQQDLFNLNKNENLSNNIDNNISLEQIINRKNDSNIINIEEEANLILRNKGNNNNRNINSDKDEISNSNNSNYLYKQEEKNNKYFDLKEDVNKEKKEDNKDNEMEKKFEDKKENEIKDNNEVYTIGKKINSKIMNRINKGRAKSSDNREQKDLKSQNILMKAKLLEKVLGNMKSPETMENNYISNNNKNEKIIIDGFENNEPSNDIEDNIPVITNKKKKRNISPFEE